jgi:hypothetical protein
MALRLPKVRRWRRRNATEYAEYLRRLLAIPAWAHDYPSFCYAAYNGQPAGVAPIFNAADAAITLTRRCGPTAGHDRTVRALLEY